MALTPRVHEEGRSRLVAYDHGAHLASWELEKEPVVWLSPAAVLDGSTAIRGGVPICFPWFADGPDGEHSPGHGVVRTATWSPAPARDDEVWAWELQDTGVADARGAHQIPGPFHLRYAVRLSPGAPEGSPALDLHLELHNPGSTAYTVEVALHTYLAVGDVERIRIEGLDGAHYLDKVTGRDEHQAGALGLTGETDRVYDRSGPVQVHDPVHARVLELAPRGATQTVVWNPWAKRSAAADDLAADSWRGFVCVESAASGQRPLTMAPGQTRTLGCSLAARTVRPV